MNLQKRHINDLGAIVHRWRTVEDTVFYEDKIIDAIWGLDMKQRVLDFETGKNPDFRIWWGFIVWCDDLNVQLLNEFETRYIDCFWLTKYMTKEEKLWVRDFQKRAMGMFKKEERIELYKQMLKEGYHEDKSA